MRKRTEHAGEIRMMDVQQLCAYLQMGRTAAVAFAEGCGALCRFGRTVRFDRIRIDQALDALMDEKGAESDGIKCEAM